MFARNSPSIRFTLLENLTRNTCLLLAHSPALRQTLHMQCVQLTFSPMRRKANGFSDRQASPPLLRNHAQHDCIYRTNWKFRKAKACPRQPKLQSSQYFSHPAFICLHSSPLPRRNGQSPPDPPRQALPAWRVRHR